MKKLFLTIAIASIGFIACNKESIQTVENEAEKLIPVTFSAFVPETKTALDGTNVIWSAGDQLNVIEVDAEGNFVAERDFSIVPEDAGKASASFTGEVANASNTFYAIYPNIKMYKGPSAGDAFSATAVAFNKANSANSAMAVVNGFDSSLAIMSAKVAADGSMVFRHAGAFLKFTVNNDNISSIRIDYDGKARMFLGRQAINLETGAPAGVDGIGNSQYYLNLTPSTGTFIKGASYLIPINIRGNTEKIGVLTLTATSEGIESSKHASFAVAPSAGNIYNLGTPTFNFSPSLTLIKNEITVTSYKAVSDTTETGVYSLYACSDSDVTVTCDGSVVTSARIDNGSVVFSVSKNEDTENHEGSITLSLNSVPYTITVIQPYEGYEPSESHTHIFYYDSSKNAQNLTDGVAGSYFTATGIADLGGDYAITNWEINGYTSTKGVKMNSGGSITFTTSSSLNSTVQFWFIRRKTGDTTAKIQIIPEGGDATVFDTPYDEPGNSSVLSLEKNTAYTIKQSTKEQAVLLVIVNEN